MPYDPADETHRKPRRLRNTPLLKYIRLASLGITLLYAGAMYMSFRRNVLPYVDDEKYKPQFSEDDREMLHDYTSNLFMKNIIDKLIKRQETKLNAEADSEDTQANK